MLYRIRCPKRIFYNVAIPWFTMNHRPWVSKVDVQFNFSADIHGPKVSTRRSGREPTKKWKFADREKVCPWSPVSLFTYRIVFCFVLFILCSIWFRFISILGPLHRLKNNNFWCSHQMSHFICDESFLRWRYQDESFSNLNMSSWSSSFSFPFIWSSWTWVWCCNWNWWFGNSLLGFTHFFTDIFGCWSFRLNI